MYKLVVFDLDGTLLDTLDDLTDAVNAALRAYALPERTKEEVRTFIGNGIVKLMERAVGRSDYPDFAGIMEVFRTYYGAHCKDKTQPYAGVIPLLRTLKERDVLTAVLSNKADFATKKLTKEYFSNLIDEAAGENEAAGILKKPSPTALLAMMEKFGVGKEETVYIGDSEVDIQTAKNAGVACISVAWGFKSESFLKEHGASVVARTETEVLKRIENTL